MIVALDKEIINDHQRKSEPHWGHMKRNMERASKATSYSDYTGIVSVVETTVIVIKFPRLSSLVPVRWKLKGQRLHSQKRTKNCESLRASALGSQSQCIKNRLI